LKEGAAILYVRVGQEINEFSFERESLLVQVKLVVVGGRSFQAFDVLHKLQSGEGL
jgi:hypothetical protein